MTLTLNEFIDDVQTIADYPNTPPIIREKINNWLERFTPFISKIKKQLQEQPLEEIYDQFGGTISMAGQGIEAMDDLIEDSETALKEENISVPGTTATYDLRGGFVNDGGAVPSYYFCLVKHSKREDGTDLVNSLVVEQRTQDGGSYANVDKPMV